MTSGDRVILLRKFYALKNFSSSVVAHARILHAAAGMDIRWCMEREIRKRREEHFRTSDGFAGRALSQEVGVTDASRN